MNPAPATMRRTTKGDARMKAYKVVDVFTDQPLLGNPVAVVMDGAGLTDAQMAAIARWTNLSETTFLLPATDPAADYALRIFTPACELPFAGHPTLGSAHAAVEGGLAAPGDGRLVQQCAAGLIPITAEPGGRFTFILPKPQVTPLAAADIAALGEVLGCDFASSAPPEIINVGPHWIVGQLADAAAILALQPDYSRLAALERRLKVTGVTLFGAHPQGGPADIEVRSFAPSGGANEDPVCGSGNGAVAVYRHRLGLRDAAYVAAQGACMGREGRVSVAIGADGEVQVGGACITTVEGAIRLAP